MKLPNRYICIDIETTDAEADKGDVIQIGAVVLDTDLSTGGDFVAHIKPTSSHRNEHAMKANQIDEKTLEEALSPEEVLGAFEKWAMMESGSDRPLLAAWGTYFDVVFLRAYYKKIGRKWPFSYRCLDLKTIAIWEVSKKGGDTAAGGVETFLDILDLKFEGKPHDALDDIKNTVRIIQNL